MSNVLQPIELTDSDLDAVSGGTSYHYKSKVVYKYKKNSNNVITTSANGGDVTTGDNTSIGDGGINLGNGGDASVSIG